MHTATFLTSSASLLPARRSANGENDHAIVEDVCGGAANIDGRVYMQQAKKLAAQLKVMRATERELRLRQRPDHEATAIPLADVAC